MIVFLDRRRQAGPYLEWKVRLFLVAAVLGLGGIYLEDRWLTGAAIALLVGGLALRFLPGGTAADSDDDSDREHDDPGDEEPREETGA